jgi:putative peptidoglycan lipid II flippase
MAAEQEKHDESTTRNSMVVMVCTLTSRIMGIVKARAIAVVFGATGIADVINFTFNIPNNFRKLFAEGALSSAFIPVFSTSISNEEGGIAQSAELLKRMQAFQILISLPMLILTCIFRFQLVQLLSDFQENGQIVLSANLLVYFMVFLFVISFAALYGGVLHSHGSFFTAAAAPLLFSIAVIFSVLFLTTYLGPYSMAFGVVVGGFSQAVVTFLRLRKYGYRMQLSFDFSYAPFRQVMMRWVPVTGSSMIAIVGQQVAFYFATMLQEGSVTAFSNAIILWQAPYGVFYSGIATVFFPAMVVAFQKNDLQRLGKLISQGLVYLATFLIPCTILLIALRKEFIAVLLQSGRFTLSDTLQTAEVLFWFLIGMVFVAWYGFLQRYCFSTERYRLTFYISILVTSLDILLTWFFITRGFGIQSLSLANTIAFGLGVIILYHKTILPLQGFDHFYLVRKIVRILIANIPLAAALISYRLASISWWQSGSSIRTFLILTLISAIAISIVLVSYLIAKVEFLQLLRKKKNIS